MKTATVEQIKTVMDLRDGFKDAEYPETAEALDSVLQELYIHRFDAFMRELIK